MEACSKWKFEPCGKKGCGSNGREGVVNGRLNHWISSISVDNSVVAYRMLCRHGSALVLCYVSRYITMQGTVIVAPCNTHSITCGG